MAHVRCSALAAGVLPWLLLASTVAAAQPAPRFELADGDTVALVGSTFIDREQQQGYIETRLVSQFPGKRSRFRNLGWDGDTVDEQHRPEKFGTTLEHLRRLKPTVLLVSYGMMESQQGEAGLAKFASKYGELLDHYQKVTARIVVVAPPPFEQGPAGSPSAAQQNKRLSSYVAVIERICRERSVVFVDLFRKLLLDQSKNGPLTQNGVHLRAYGYWRVGQVIASELGLNSPEGEAWVGTSGRAGPELNRAEKLRALIQEKNELFYYRYRPHNGEYVYGRRSKTFSSNSGNNQFPAEMAKFDELIAAADEQIRLLSLPESHRSETTQEDTKEGS